MPKLKKEFLQQALQEQRHLLEKSVTAMTKGDLAEALRVATCLRVLIHETARNKPLLKQLNQNYLELDILDLAPSEQRAVPHGVVPMIALQFPVGFRVVTGPDGGVYLNDDVPPETLAPTILEKWWTRPSSLIIPAGGFSRKEIVLGLADKEGGTHVDPDISAKYQQLLDCKTLRVGFNQQLEPLNLSRLMVGQAGLDVLKYLNKHFPESK